LALSLTLNAVQAYIIFSAQQQGQVSNHQQSHLPNQLQTIEAEANLVNVDLSETISKLPLTTKTTRNLRLVALFSPKDCSACLDLESAKWSYLYQTYPVDVYGVCIDSAMASVFRYRTIYKSEFPVFLDSLRVFSYLKPAKAPTVLLLNRRNQVILSYIAQVGNKHKHEKFYAQLESLLSTLL
jgi:hypothetical protein